jgi:hypothetical protein
MKATLGEANHYPRSGVRFGSAFCLHQRSEFVEFRVEEILCGQCSQNESMF